VGRGEHLITGFRNRDVRGHQDGERSRDAAVYRRQSGRVGRLLGLLRAHGLIQKIPRTHRYQVTARGREQIAAILAARAAAVEKLVGAA
jgi:DNA-binding PadR family transcriptional regulator